MKEKTNIKKICILCNNTRYAKNKLCRDCIKIKEHIHKYGMVSIVHFIDSYKYVKPSAPPY